ncbi:laminin subunit alpha-3 isoform X2 [Lepisosteus oculatus]|uniref:laminin subunit alpha-3 isoform X2 n=1 Tax=Lepisosteus oculatus TaxID=7918 RepID=UPI00371E93C8
MSDMARRTRRSTPAAPLFPLFLALLHSVRAQLPANEVAGFSLHPPYFNLAEGARISATATCGEDEAGRPKTELYCKLVGGPAAGLASQTIQGQFCGYCNSHDPSTAHPASNAIDGTERWWQSPPLSSGLEYNEVNVTMDLGQLFHVAYVLIKFANSPRPDLWVLEHSVDFGRTYSAWQYFAHAKGDCIERFGKDPNGRIYRDDDQICTTEYSRIVPLENGEIVVSLVNGRPGAKNFSYSPVLQDFTKATNIRLHFLRTNTLLGHLISKAQRDPTVTRRYYYSIKDISVGGRCVCHGHAQVCDARNPANPFRLQCDCQHNTCGETCDRCCPGFNQKPWQVATSESANACEACECHSHTSECYYDPEVDRRRASLNIYGRYEGGGVCINCQHNTAGINCERCRQGYYRPYGVPKESPTGCIPCRCDPRSSEGCEEGSGRCSCKPNFSGENCERCADGHYGFPQCIRFPVFPTTTKSPADHIVDSKTCPARYFGPPNCQPCRCSGPGAADQFCDMLTGDCRCRTEFQGKYCERCAPGHFNYPNCQACFCNPAGCQPEVCDASGQCLCRPEVEGSRCDQCRSGYHSFPVCQACSCEGAGAVDQTCGPRGQCRCHTNYAGLKCNQCASGHYGYPSCYSCQCHPEGSSPAPCDQVSGQCSCRPGVAGLRCDRCAEGGFDFPLCQVPNCNPAGTEFNALDTHPGSCQCLPDVEGPFCDRCKPLYWNLAQENPNGCIECQCEVKGTVSGIGECQQQSGECYCKPNTCSHTCNACKDGYFNLQKSSYFGCQGCQCDVGGSVSHACDERSGQCQCRPHVVGRTCNQPETNFYFPDLHHIKYEVEDGVTPSGRTARFGYDQREFPDFSWRGYATMSSAQPEVVLPVTVTSSSLYRIIVRFATPASKTPARGRILVAEEVHFPSCCNWPGQSKEVIFPPSSSPAFITVPGNGFTDPFPLLPGKWVISIKAEGVLLDYLVLLPSSYYEAPILSLKVTEPCTYESSAENSDWNCLLYKHVPMDGFPAALGTEGLHSTRVEVRIQQPTPQHPEMVSFSGRQARLQQTLRVPQPGKYVVVLEYASEDEALQSVTVMIGDQPAGATQGRVNIFSCKYSFLCRSAAVDEQNRIAVYELPHKFELLLQASTARFLLYKAYVVPAEEFSTEYVNPKVFCISTPGRFSEDRFCIPSKYELPPSATVLDAVRDGRLSFGSELPQSSVLQQGTQGGGPLSPYNPRGDGVLLKFPQNQISFRTRLPREGRYVFVVHFRQPEHLSYAVRVQVDGGRPWLGSFNASYCPHVSGCRDQVIAENRIVLDVPEQELVLTLAIPQGKTLTMDYILVVPADNYTPDLLSEKRLDKSFDFIHKCGGNSFYIDPVSSSPFCKDSARSLVAFFNGGALPCGCDEAGATGPACAADGGQCTCRPNVIGRRCSRCATGYYGFPYCRPCDCGRRLCDEVTGQCICPPQTVKPSCDVCQEQTFAFHPLVGCEECNCSRRGVVSSAITDCDRADGQCRCRPRIAGRKCDVCAAGYYRFPECVPCDCNLGGARPEVCDPQTGRCLCKKNVVGAKCDACRPGSFYFDPANPNGCTSCFCFGATSQCRKSGKRRSKFVSMRMWRLEKLDQEEVPAVFNPASNTVVADIQELPASVHDLYWVAPPSYLGDRVSSYGGYLTYQVKSFGIPSEGMKLLERRADVQLTGQQMTLVHLDPQNPSPDKLYQGRVQLVEGNFRHATTSSPVSREELMMVLAGLGGLRVRALHFSESQRLSLGEVGLEEASNSGSGVAASAVEECTCPPELRGDSCQKCAPGYYRDKTGPYLGRCVPCTCNGLSSECEDGTGKCLNCQHNTAGDKCERCKEGFYGDALQKNCQVCPCPFNILSNSFATGCKDVGGGFECVCKPGYAGRKCERCAPGYYGDPMAFGGSCRPCNCNNGNPSSCDPRTGVCRSNEEPKDTTSDGQCQECDSCVQTLLSDLERMDDELLSLKSQLENAGASSIAKEKMKNLEDAIAATKNLISKYSSSLDSQKSKVSGLESDTINLTQDINILKEKAERNSLNSQIILGNIDLTSQRAMNLVTEARTVFGNVQELLRSFTERVDGQGVPGEDFQRMLADAERMVREMEQRSCSAQKEMAHKEKDEAKKLLDRVQNDLTKQLENNQQAAKRVGGLLNQYESKLEDLEEALKQAREAVKKANDQNGVNALSLRDAVKRMEDLQEERNKVASQIGIAKAQVEQTEDLLGKLQDSKKEYEELAAKLDGAKTDLSRKVNELSKAASKEDIVERAEKHAENLDRLASELQEAVKNASGSSEVRCAVEAIEAYKNITDAVKAAEDAAKQAKAAADKALRDVQQEDLTRRAKDLKNSAANLLSEAGEEQNDLKTATSDLATLQNRLKDAEKKKKSLQNDLLTAQNELNQIRRADIGDAIEEAKGKAADVNMKVENVMGRVKTIDNELSKINIGRPVDSNLEKIIAEVDQSVQNLTNTIPSLLDKFSMIEEMNSQMAPPSNISENIKRIKELIAMARNAADKIVVPMKFDGNAHVELRPPSSTEDLKAYTSLSFYLQRPVFRGDRRRRQASDSGDLFVLYLGSKDVSKDYIGMGLKNNRLFCIYKLMGEEYEINVDTSVTDSKTEESILDKIDFNRIYQDAEVYYTKLFTSNNPDPPKQLTNAGKYTRNLLSLEPSEVVFYVGGYPDSFTPPSPLNLPKYRGCIEFSSMNDKFISLYNFKNAVNVNVETPCKRYKRGSEFWYFEGTGYAKIAIGKSVGTFRQDILCRAENGLLFYIGNEDSFYSVSIENGFIVWRSKERNAPLKESRGENKIFPSDTLKSFNIILTRDKFIISGAEKLISDYNGIGTYTEYYIGGIPMSIRESKNITTPPLKGCLKNIQSPEGNAQFEESVGVSPGCPNDFLISRDATFSLGSSLTTSADSFDLGKDVMVAMGFRTTEKTGLLLHNSQADTGMELSLDNGFVVFKFKDKVWKSNYKYEDGKWHYLTAAKTSQSITLRIDEEDEGRDQPSSSLVTSMNTPNIILGKDTFEGCLTNVYMRRPVLYKPEDLSRFSSTGNVSVGSCSAEKPPLSMMARTSLSRSSLRRGNEVKEEAMELERVQNTSGCRLPDRVRNAFQLGESHGRLEYNVTPQIFQDRSHISLDIRTKSQEGLIFYAANKFGTSHVALYINNGRIKLSLSSPGKKRKIFNKEKYNDGKWHTVMFSWEKRSFRLVVDGLRAQDGDFTQVSSLQLQPPIYLGNVPALSASSKLQILPKNSVVGCIRNFKLNDRPMAEPTDNYGVPPCFEGNMESGAYFSGNGGYVVLDKSFVVGVNFELVFEIHPRNLTGVLFHVSGQSGHHLSLFIKKGEVIVQVNNGAGDFRVAVTPQPTFCDGAFHRIAVIKRNNVVQLDVDTEGRYTVGPSSSYTTQTRDPLYVGGIPDPSQRPELPVSASFVGCLQNVRINGDLASFSKAVEVYGPVSLRSCPAS